MEIKEIEIPYLGTWAALRKEYLQTKEPEEWNRLVETGQIVKHLEEFEEETWPKAQELETQLKAQAGMTLELQRKDIMKYIGLANNVQAQWMELMRAEIMHED
jgi:hypothetical protein